RSREAQTDQFCRTASQTGHSPASDAAGRGNLAMSDMTIVRTSRDEIEVYRFGPFISVLVPLLALVIQAFVPARWHGFAVLDLPLLVTIFFAVTRSSQMAGLMTGAIIGLVQDALTHQAIGLYGIAKTVVGYGASSLGVK